MLALTSGSNSNLFGISGKTHHVHQLILDQAQQSLNTLSGDVASLLERSSVSVRTSFFFGKDSKMLSSEDLRLLQGLFWSRASHAGT